MIVKMFKLFRLLNELFIVAKGLRSEEFLIQGIIKFFDYSMPPWFGLRDEHRDYTL